MSLKPSLIAFALFFLFLLPPSVLAHVVVKPDEVGVGKFQTFTVGVPNEKDVPTVGVRLVIPEGLQHVTPNVKQGWNIQTAPDAEGDGVVEIIWSEGIIPPGQRDEFLFSAQVPAEQTNLIWKAYQIYNDGTTVSWDVDPNTMKEPSKDQEEDESTSGPYSQTQIINDLENEEPEKTQPNTTPMVLSTIAIILGGTSLAFHVLKKK